MKEADLLLLGGRIYTPGDKATFQEGLGIRDGRIIAVGTNSEMESLGGRETKRIHLGGKLVLPGFRETHLHPASAGLLRTSWIDCNGSRSIEAILKAVETKAATARPSAWIRGQGYDESRLSEGRAPNRWDLDRVAPRNPVAITKRDGHVMVVNSMALDLARIDRETPDPSGGLIYRNSDGVPNGILGEKAKALVEGVIPKPTLEEQKEGIRSAQRLLVSYGITSYDEALVTRGEIQAYQELRKEGQLILRVGLILSGNFVEEPIAADAMRAGFTTGFGDSWLSFKGIKLIADGSMASETAATYDSYTKSGGKGKMILAREDLVPLIRTYVQAGIRPCIHAIGDRAVDEVVSAISEVNRTISTQESRVRIEHCGLVTKEALENIKSLNVMVSSTYSLLYIAGDNHRDLIPSKVFNQYYPCRSYFDRGIVVASNSDWPSTPPNPMLSIYAVMTRMTEKGFRYPGNETVSIQEALRMFHENAAYVDFEEDRMGSLSPGKFADLAVFADDLFTIEPKELLNAKPVMVMVGGEVVYSDLS